MYAAGESWWSRSVAGTNGRASGGGGGGFGGRRLGELRSDAGPVQKHLMIVVVVVPRHPGKLKHLKHLRTALFPHIGAF